VLWIVGVVLCATVILLPLGIPIEACPPPLHPCREDNAPPLNNVPLCTLNCCFVNEAKLARFGGLHSAACGHSCSGATDEIRLTPRLTQQSGDVMVKTLFFASGAAVGFVMGTRAGRQTYEKMRDQSVELLHKSNFCTTPP
jgi:hypothetical protein